MIPEAFYHIHNRGNNSQQIFFEKENYNYSLRKVERYFTPHIDILAYCLMQNHFHFLINTKSSFDSDKWSNDLRIMLSSYTRAINKQEGRTGSLFQQHTKVKPLEGSSRPTYDSGRTTWHPSDYPFTCFHYIHQNPIKAGIVKRMEDYEFSSFREYLVPESRTICNKKIAFDLLGIPKDTIDFLRMSNNIYNPK